MRIRWMIMGAALFIVGGLTACGSPDDAVPVAFADICAEDDRWISAEGILTLGDETWCETTGDMEQCHIVLLNPDDPGQAVTVTLEIGDENNRMASLPESYTDADLLVKDNAGAAVGTGSRVRVIGPASNDEAQYACRVWVRQIEAVQ